MTGRGSYSNSITFSTYQTLIWSMALINFSGGKLESGRPGSRTPNINVSATECGLWYCVNRYTSAVEDGILREHVESAPTENRNPQGRKVDWQLGGKFNVSRRAFNSTKSLMQEAFSIGQLKEAQKITAFVANKEETLMQGRDRERLYYQPAAMQMLYNSPNLTTTFTSLAKSMTNRIRESDDNNTMATGKLGTYMILIRVRPWYLTLPLIITLGGAAFFVIIAYHSRKAKLAVFGTNALPLIALGENVGPMFDGVDITASKMGKAAKGLHIQIPASRGWCHTNASTECKKQQGIEMVAQTIDALSASKDSPICGVSEVTDDVSNLEVIYNEYDGHWL